jgi:hypothetical protein
VVGEKRPPPTNTASTCAFRRSHQQIVDFPEGPRCASLCSALRARHVASIPGPTDQGGITDSAERWFVGRRVKWTRPQLQSRFEENRSGYKPALVVFKGALFCPCACAPTAAPQVGRALNRIREFPYPLPGTRVPDLRASCA